MIGYVTLGTSDLPRAAAFYDTLLADATDTVDRVHCKVLESDGSDEGPAGPRGDGFYAGHFRDLDGYKLCVFKAG